MSTDIQKHLDTIKDICDIDPELDLYSIWQVACSPALYKVHKIPKSDGSFRRIEAPIDTLKYIQRKLLTLFDKFPLCAEAYGHKGTSATTNAIVHTNSKIIVKMDIKKFFPSVTLAHFYKAIKGLSDLDLPDLYRIASGFCFINAPSGQRLPTGAPTSPIISSIAFTPVDLDIAHIAYQHNMTYSRYIDDLTFGTTEKYPAGFQGKINSAVKAHNFRINHKKSQILYQDNHPMMITGVSVNYETFSVGRQYKRKLRAELDWQAKYDTELTPALQGKLAYVNQVNPSQYKKFQNYFFERVKKYHDKNTEAIL